MTVNRLLLATLPAALMITTMLAMLGIETWLSDFGASPQAKLMLGRLGLALPYAAAAAIGVIALFATLKGYRFAASEGIGSAVTELAQRLMPRRQAAGGRA